MSTSDPPHISSALPRDDRDFAGIYRACAGFHLAAGLFGISEALTRPELRRRHRVAGLLGATLAVTVGIGGMLRPHELARLVRRRPAVASITGIAAPAILTGATGGGSSPLFFESAIVSATGAGVVGARNGPLHGALSLASALVGIGVPARGRDPRHPGWVPGAIPVVFFNASMLAAWWGDESLRMRAVHETVDREQERATKLRELAEKVENLLEDNRRLTAEIAKWGQQHLEDVDRELVARRTGRQHQRAQQLLASAQAREIEPDRLPGALADIVAQWRRHGLDERGVSVELSVAPKLPAHLDHRLASATVLVVSRALQNVLRHAEWAKHVTVKVRRRVDGWVELTVEDDGGGSLPPSVGDGLTMCRDRFERELGGTFFAYQTAAGIRIVAAAPPPRAEPEDTSLQGEHGGNGREDTRYLAAIAERNLRAGWPLLVPAVRAWQAGYRAVAATALIVWLEGAITGMLDRPAGVPARRVAAVSVGTVAGSEVLGLLVARGALSWPLRVALGVAAPLLLPHDQFRPPLSGWMLDQLAGVAWEKNPEIVVAGHVIDRLAVAWTWGDGPELAMGGHLVHAWAARGPVLESVPISTAIRAFPGERAVAVRELAGVVGPLTCTYALIVLGRRWRNQTAKREALVGSAIDRNRLADELYDALAKRHDLTDDLMELDPLLPVGFVDRRNEQEKRFQTLKRDLAKFSNAQPAMVEAIRRVVEWRVAPARVHVDVDPLWQPPDQRPATLVAAHRDRAALVELVAQSVDELLKDYPLSLLGGRSLANLSVSLRRHRDDLVLTFTPRPPSDGRTSVDIGRLLRQAAPVGAVFDGEFRDGRLSYTLVGAARQPDL